MIEIRTYFIHGKIPSVNRSPIVKGLRKKYQVDVLDPFYESVKIQMLAQDNSKGFDRPTGNHFITSFMFYFPDNRKRDDDNHVKILKDGVFKYLEVDDSCNIGSITWKQCKRDGANQHGARVQIMSVDEWFEPSDLLTMLSESIGDAGIIGHLE